MTRNLNRKVSIIMGLIGTLMVFTFIIGLSHSISTGFAGFWGGMPFMLIAIFVMSLAAYDWWDTAVRATRKNDDRS